MGNSKIPEQIAGCTIDGSLTQLEVARLIWRPSAHALIFNDEGHLLVLDNTKNGKCEFPGGGVEVWETLREAVVREVWEETGLNAEVGEMFHTQESFFLTPGGNHWHTLQYYFFVTIVGGTLRNTIIPDEYTVNPHWVEPTKLIEDDLTKGWEALQRALTLRPSST